MMEVERRDKEVNAKLEAGARCPYCGGRDWLTTQEKIEYGQPVNWWDTFNPVYGWRPLPGPGNRHLVGGRTTAIWCNNREKECKAMYWTEQEGYVPYSPPMTDEELYGI